MKTRSLVSGALLALAALLAPISAQADPAPPGKPLAFAFAPHAVAVANSTPGATVVLFGIGKEYAALYLTRHMWKETATDDDGDGRIHLDVPTGVPAQSVWVAVDLGSGQSAMAAASPEGTTAISGVGLGARRRDGIVRTLRDRRKQAYAILATGLPRAPGSPPPGAAAGAWFLGAGDGNPHDADGQENGLVELDLLDAEPLGTTTPPEIPESVTGGDRVYVIDPDTLEYYSAPLAGLPEIVD